MARNRILWALAAVVFAATTALSQDKGDDMQVLKQRLVADWLARPADAKAVSAWIKSQKADGSWPDVQYVHETRTNWRPAEHLGRLGRMARALKAPDSPLQNNAALRKALLAGLKLWFDKDPICPNWWYNEIGGPRELGQLMLIAEEDLPAEVKAIGIERLKRAKIGMTGQNLVWLAINTAYRGLLAGDADLVDTAFDRIWGEITDDKDEGVQPDASFFQHGRQLYVGGYGHAFAGDASTLLALTRGTRFFPPQEKVAIVTRYLLDGMQWMVRGGQIDPNTLGRGITRPVGSNEGFLAGICRDMLQIETGRADEFRAWLKRIEATQPGAQPALEGNRHFWTAEFMVQHSPACYASVKVLSKRTIGNESGNSEGLKNWLLLFGPSFVMRRGDEYRNIAPVWDWTLAPGITAPQRTTDVPEITWGRGAAGQTDFAGGVSDGRAGLAAMDFARDEVRYRKAWALFDDGHVVLIAGITGGELPVRSSLNQCWRKGDVWAAQDGRPRKLADGAHTLENLDWVHHDGIGYVLPAGGAALHVAARKQGGSWYAINHSRPRETVEGEVFTAWIDHGKNAAGASAVYSVLPGVERAAMAEAAAAWRRDVKVVANTTKVQAVLAERKAEGQVTMASFYEAGGIAPAGGIAVAVDKPCLVLLRRTADALEISVASPEAKAIPVTLTIGLRLTGDGVKAGTRPNQSVVVIDLPAGPLAGSTVTRRLAAQK